MVFGQLRTNILETQSLYFTVHITFQSCFSVSLVMLLNQVFWSLGLGILFGLGNVMLK